MRVSAFVVALSAMVSVAFSNGVVTTTTTSVASSSAPPPYPTSTTVTPVTTAPPTSTTLMTSTTAATVSYPSNSTIIYSSTTSHKNITSPTVPPSTGAGIALSPASVIGVAAAGVAVMVGGAFF